MTYPAKNRLLPLMLALVMALTLTACGGSGDSGALTEEEYQQEVENLSAELTTVQTDAANLDPTDVDGAKQLIEDLKQPFQDFAALNPPESYQEAHEKLSSGCQAMNDFLDTTASLLEETDPAKLQEGSTEMMNALQTAMTDISEGAALLDGAANG